MILIPIVVYSLMVPKEMKSSSNDRIDKYKHYNNIGKVR